ATSWRPVATRCPPPPDPEWATSWCARRGGAACGGDLLEAGGHPMPAPTGPGVGDQLVCP
ncbi:hypothetical protein ABZV61_33550, partial [Streptomyces sp900116325]